MIPRGSVWGHEQGEAAERNKPHLNHSSFSPQNITNWRELNEKFDSLISGFQTFYLFVDILLIQRLLSASLCLPLTVISTAAKTPSFEITPSDEKRLKSPIRKVKIFGKDVLHHVSTMVCLLTYLSYAKILGWDKILLNLHTELHYASLKLSS